MNKRASELLGRFTTAWGRSTATQRWLGAGLLLSLGVATGLSYYLNQPQWVDVINQADPKDAAAVVARLQELKVPYRPIGDGYTIQVPKSEQYTAKLALAEAGLPKGGSVGMEIFNQPQFGATDFDRRVNYLRAQQGELERALIRINELAYANVKLAIPEQTVFTRDQQPVTAAVMLQLRPGRKLNRDQVAGIVDFVSSSVQGLSPDHVRVVDESGRLLSVGLDAASGLDGGSDGEQLQRQITMQQDMEQRVQTLLEPIFGQGNVVARVNLTLNLDTSRVENQTVGSSTPKSVDVLRESGQGIPLAAPAGPTGAAAPPVYQGQTPTGMGDQTRTHTTTEYDVSQRKEVTLVAPGSVKQISVGIAVNRPDLTPAQVKQIQDTVAGATGADVAAISVATMAFTPPPVAAASASGRGSTPAVVGAGAALALLLALFLIMRRRQAQPVPEMADAFPLAETEPGGGMLNVALGLDTEPLVPLTEVAAAAELESESLEHKMAVGIRTRPKRQLKVDDHELDGELLAMTDDLMVSSSEACAEVIRQWLKGGG